MKQSSDLLVLTVLTLLAIATRGYGISDWHIVGDEATTISTAASRYRSLVNPAYYALVLGSFEMLGVSEWSARLPAMLLGILSIPVFYATWKNILGRNAAFIGALLIVLSSWHLWYSQYSRFYTGVFLFGSLSYYLYYQAIRLDSLAYLMWALLANVAGVLFHLTVVMVPASCAVFSFIILLSKRFPDSGYSRRIAAVYLGICSCAGLIGVALLWAVAAERASVGVTWGDTPLGMMLQVTRRVQLPVALSAFFGLMLLLQRDVFKGIFFALGIGIPILFVLAASIFLNSRSVYMFYALPLIIALAAYLCDELRQALSNQRYLSHAFTIILLTLLLPELISHYTGRASLDVREAVGFVEKGYQPGDQIVSSVRDFNYYAGKEYPIERMRSPYARSVTQLRRLQAHKDEGQRAWIILEAYRSPYAADLEAWLLGNASLVWRKFEKRLDYEVHGYEIFLLNGRAAD